MKLRRPQGNIVVSALKRYDPNIDVRWSWERRMWALTTRPLRPELIPAPVRWMKTEAGWAEQKLDEFSEAHIAYRTKTMPIGYVARLTWSVFVQVVETDTWRNGRISRQLARMQEVAERDRKRVSQDRWREARKYMNWHARTHPMSA